MKESASPSLYYGGHILIVRTPNICRFDSPTRGVDLFSRSRLLPLPHLFYLIGSATSTVVVSVHFFLFSKLFNSIFTMLRNNIHLSARRVIVRRLLSSDVINCLSRSISVKSQKSQKYSKST